MAETPRIRAGAELWTEPDGLTKVLGSRGRRWAAIAFVGTDGPRLLPLEAGDVLVVNSSDSALTSGATNPDALKAFIDKGVEVWSHRHLHAKAATTARGRSIVGSANASANSNRLAEAVVVLRGPEAREQIRAFVEGLIEHSTQVDDAFVRRARQKYRPPSVGGRPGADGDLDKDLFDDVTRIWLGERQDYTPDPAVAADMDHEIDRMSPAGVYEGFFTDADWTPDVEDVLVWINRDRSVEPPMRVRTLPSSGTHIGGRGDERYGIGECSRSHRSVTRDRQTPRVRTLVEDAIRDGGMKELVDADDIRAVLACWPSADPPSQLPA